VPDNAFLTSPGQDWECDRGFRRADGGCEAVEVPANAFLSGRATGRATGRGWTCDRGFLTDAAGCLPMGCPRTPT